MSLTVRQNLAERLLQNWVAKHPPSSSAPPLHKTHIDDSLTSLDWLCNLNIKNLIRSATCNSTQSTTAAASHESDPLITSHPPARMSQGKPSHSYATMIRMAIRESPGQRATLSQIYSWIQENFPFYRNVEDLTWQNSIRHNLSLNKSFQKVARGRGEPGKGNFWCYVPEQQEGGLHGKRTRTQYCQPATPPTMKRMKREEEEAVDGLWNSGFGDLNQVSSGYSLLDDETRDSLPAAYNQDDADHALMDETSQDELNMEDFGLDNSWEPILNQDIQIGGVKVTAQDIIDDEDILISCFMQGSEDTLDNKENVTPARLPTVPKKEPQTYGYPEGVYASSSFKSDSHDRKDAYDFSSYPVDFSSPWKANSAYASELEQALAFFDN